MKKPYREPQPPPDDKIILTHDYAADVRASRDPRRLIRSVGVTCLLIVAWTGVRALLFGGGIDAWVLLSGFSIVVFTMVVLPISIMIRRREDEKMNVADLLDDTDERGRK